MAKQSELFLIAREYLELFPQRKLYGRTAAEKQLAAVMQENGWDLAELQYRMRQWSRTRTDVAPWDLSKPLPQRAIAKTVPAPVIQQPPVSGEVPEAWKARVRWIYSEYLDEV